MRIRNLIIGGVAAFIATPALAGETGASREEHIGVGTGVVIGAVAGGPVGAILGAAVGAKLGDVFHRKDEREAFLASSLERSRAEVATLRADVSSLEGRADSLNAELERLRTMSRPELLRLLNAGIEFDLLFRTDQHVLAGETSERLAAMAGQLAKMSDVQIRLDGYADARGDEAYNQALSQKRAEHIRDLLVASGVPAERIQVTAHGETAGVDESLDTYALSRKVSLTLFMDAVPALVANP